MLLILADRINGVEGIVTDVMRGRPPNPLVEMGMVKRSRSREAALATAAVAGLAAGGAIYLSRRRR